jgi:hypothetical protein
MIDAMNWTNLNGQVWQFNTDTCPLKEFTVEVANRTVAVERMQEHGEWPAYSYQGAMLIHINGDLLYNDATAYMAGRIQMLQTLCPAGVVVNTRRMGTFNITFTGQEPMYSDDVTLDALPSIPMRALYPSVTEFDITFKVFRPYLIGAGSGRFYTI